MLGSTAVVLLVYFRISLTMLTSSDIQGQSRKKNGENGSFYWFLLFKTLFNRTKSFWLQITLISFMAKKGVGKIAFLIDLVAQIPGLIGSEWSRILVWRAAVKLWWRYVAHFRHTNFGHSLEWLSFPNLS